MKMNLVILGTDGQRDHHNYFHWCYDHTWNHGSQTICKYTAHRTLLLVGRFFLRCVGPVAFLDLPGPHAVVPHDARGIPRQYVREAAKPSHPVGHAPGLRHDEQVDEGRIEVRDLPRLPLVLLVEVEGLLVVVEGHDDPLGVLDRLRARVLHGLVGVAGEKEWVARLEHRGAVEGVLGFLHEFLVPLRVLEVLDAVKGAVLARHEPVRQEPGGFHLFGDELGDRRGGLEDGKPQVPRDLFVVRPPGHVVEFLGHLLVVLLVLVEV
mmetsp:Transcript_5189/g.10873  ORF Transcript_5189/g.10873 Transcript_5189/m.10873 type:complete len:265 (+) Transcript_5189:448-1242(+)